MRIKSFDFLNHGVLVPIQCHESFAFSGLQQVHSHHWLCIVTWAWEIVFVMPDEFLVNDT